MVIIADAVKTTMLMTHLLCARTNLLAEHTGIEVRMYVQCT